MFQNLEFIVFFAALICALRTVASPKIRATSILSFGIVWLAWLDFKSALILVSLSWVAWAASRVATKRKLWATLASVASIASLAFFKYNDFFLSHIKESVGYIGIPLLEPAVAITLPLGISFYCLQSVAYSIDAYRNSAIPTKNFSEHLLFMSYFPKLVMGPIERQASLLPQLGFVENSTQQDLRIGICQFGFGLMKKIAIADHLGTYVDAVYSSPGNYSSSTVWLATVAYSIQLYCDFSGYTDMAIGTSRMLGVRLAENFSSPYLAISIKDFWRRWHTSLSSWLGDYVYKPLGGRGTSLAQNSLNIVVVFLVSGIWHGPTLNFVLWGLAHGVMYVIYLCWRSWGPSAPSRPNIARVLAAWIITMTGVLLSRVIFRASDLESAKTAYKQMFSSGGSLYVDPNMAMAAPGIFLVAIVEATGGRSAKALSIRLSERSLYFQWAFAYVMFVAALALQSKLSANFIYFRF